ncbi:MAG: SCO family protein [Planctomycetota bacterium]|nr:MAG: SCO family protein [Planctomycetota bacterium]
MTSRRAIQLARSAAILAAALCAQVATAQPGGAVQPLGSRGSVNETPAQQENVGVTEHLGEPVPLDLPFINSDGDLVTLGDSFVDGRPVILALVYYDCPVVCAVVMGKLTEAFSGIDFNIGEDYNVVFASIDPSETPALASPIKDRYLSTYDRTNGGKTAAGWSFLTSPADSTRALAEAVGWDYKPVAGGEYSHPVCIFVLTPDGRIARYVYGVGYESETMRMALLEASDGKVSESIGDKIRMFCYRYDPATGKYALVAFRVVQLGGVLSMLAVGSLVGVLLIKERMRGRRLGAAGSRPDAGDHPTHAQPVSESKI